MSRSLTAVLVALVYVGCNAAQDNQKILLKWNVKPQQRYEYMIKMAISGGEQMGTLDGTIHFAERILNVSPTEISQSIYCAGMSMRGTGVLQSAINNMEEMRGFSYTKIVSPTGKARATEGLPSELFGNSIDLILPENEVAVGDTWSDKFKPNEQIGEADVTYKLVSFDAKDAIIEASLKKTDNIESTKPYVFTVDRASGRYRQAQGEITVIVQTFKIAVSFQMVMIAPQSLRSTKGWK
jgi:uncharacterized lipoprotein NlpE involved in copper resistance